MKEIKAYVRHHIMAQRVIDALVQDGISGMTVINVEAIGAECDPQNWHISEYVQMYSRVVKLEIVCTDEEVGRFVRIIKENGHTGFKGDGMVFVSDIERAVSIRTGKEGDEALINID